MSDLPDTYHFAVGRLTLAAATMEVLIGELAHAAGAPTDAVSFLSTSGMSGGAMQMLQTAGEQLPAENEINALHRDATALLIERDALVHAVTMHDLRPETGTPSDDVIGTVETVPTAPLPSIEQIDDLVERLHTLSTQALGATRLATQGVVDPISTEEQL
jgi:hypothetical protein